MSNASPAPPPGPTGPELLSTAETHVGQALGLLHRALARLDVPERTDAVQAVLEQAEMEIEAARTAHEQAMAALRPPVADAETLALIAAAVAVVLSRPHRVLDVRKAPPTGSWVNAWAIEGRFQHYSSHRVR